MKQRLSENRKKVAILLPWMKVGGTNKIGLNFIKVLSKYCDVTLILSFATGEWMQDIPDDIHLIIDQIRPFREMLFEDLRRVRIGMLFRDAVYYLNVRTGRDSIDNYAYIVRRHDRICDEVFDCAISYHGQSPERLLNLLYRTHARMKAVWIHGRMSISVKQLRRMQKYYDRVDHFFFVSEVTRCQFADCIAFDRKDSTVYYNPMDKQDILVRAEEFDPGFSAKYMNLLTVGRLANGKGQNLIPQTTRGLLDQGYQVRWYIVGDGEMRAKVEQEIRRFDVGDAVFLLGTKKNPYPYMKACDIYVQPSFSEGYSTTICEAAILGKAIIGTKPSGGIREQIRDGVDGLIVDATVEGIGSAIRHLIDDEMLRHQFEREIVKRDFEKRDEIHKFLELLPHGHEQHNQDTN